jgi:KDO2-lipid IV(A) lauroyltransferase
LKAFLFKTVLKLSRNRSLEKNRSFSKKLGRIVWLLASNNRKITQRNIKKCFPSLSAEDSIQLAKESLNSTLMSVMELGLLWDKKVNVDDYIERISGLEDFSKSLAENKGLLLALPHIGNWEVLNTVLSKFPKFAFLYKPPSDAKIEKILVENRGQSNATQIEANIKGVRKIMMHLKDKGFVTILPDQRPKDGQGVFTPFFNIPTYTMTLFSKLANKTKVPVFFAYALRTEKGFEVFFEESAAEIYADLDTSVAYMNQKIQQIVEKAPEQYQWTYKRFSIQPEGEPKFYK